MAPYVSCMVAAPDPMIEPEPKPVGQRRITCIDEQGRTWWLSEDSAVGDWLEYVANGGTVDEAPPPPIMPPPEITAPERDYGAEIDALDARVTALENP